jgi:PAS domain S-box-containing protein
VDASIVGIFMWDVEGQILETNDEFLRIVGYDREDLASGRLRWTDLTPPEWLELDRRERVPEPESTGNLQPFEKEYFRKDGSRVPVLIGGTRSEETGDQGVAFVLDLTERKRAQEQLRNTQAELANMMRITTMGQLAASIVHEVNQPLSGIVSNASAALRFLSGIAPNLEEAREAARDIVRDGKRASEVITRLRGLHKTKEIIAERVDLNEATREVVALLLSELERNRVVLQPELAEDLPLITGDRVQLQQVRSSHASALSGQP